MPVSYRLSCCAPWTSESLASFCALFQARAVNIRRLVMAPVFHQPAMCHLEMQFVVPDGSEQFVEDLQGQLKTHACQRVDLVAV